MSDPSLSDAPLSDPYLPLPSPFRRYELPHAYASAHVVLAAAIDTQSRIGMINNRVFEALACGAVVVSDNYTALHALAAEVLLLVDDGPEVAEYLHKVGSRGVVLSESLP